MKANGDGGLRAGFEEAVYWLTAKVKLKR